MPATMENAVVKELLISSSLGGTAGSAASVDADAAVWREAAWGTRSGAATARPPNPPRPRDGTVDGNLSTGKARGATSAPAAPAAPPARGRAPRLKPVSTVPGRRAGPPRGMSAMVKGLIAPAVPGRLAGGE
jgi:hypothetical protein